MNKVATIPQPKEIFAEMREAMGDLVHSVKRLADAYKQGLESDPIEWFNKVRDEFPSIAPSFWHSIERVSTGRLLPEVVARGCAGLQVFGKISLAEQRRVLDNGFSVWTSGADHRVIPAHLADVHTIRNIVVGNRVLTVEEQAARARQMQVAKDEWIAERKASIKEMETEDAEIPLKWRVEHKKVFILECPTYLSQREIRAMLADLEASK